MSIEVNIDKNIIDFIGPEGSGKSTIARLLASKTKKPYISVGDILRDMKEHDHTELGDECRAMFSEHRYLDPNMLLLIQEKYLQNRNDLSNGFILDGGLRTVTEAQGFACMLIKAGKNMPVTVVHLRVPGWMGADRLVAENGRRRDDDTPAAVLNRLRNFYKDLAVRSSLIDQQFRLIHIDATKDIDTVFNLLCKSLTEI